MDWSLIVTGVSIAATIGNAKQQRWCFKAWLFTNSFWFVWDFIHGLYSQAVLFLVYFFISVYGLWKWKKKAMEAEQAAKSLDTHEGA